VDDRGMEVRLRPAPRLTQPHIQWILGPFP